MKNTKSWVAEAFGLKQKKTVTLTPKGSRNCNLTLTQGRSCFGGHLHQRRPRPSRRRRLPNAQTSQTRRRGLGGAAAAAVAGSSDPSPGWGQGGGPLPCPLPSQSPDLGGRGRRWMDAWGKLHMAACMSGGHFLHFPGWIKFIFFRPIPVTSQSDYRVLLAENYL